MNRAANKYEKLKAELEKKKESYLATDASIAELISKRDSLTKAITDAQISIKKYNHKISAFYSDREKAKKSVDTLLNEHPWIAKEEQYVLISLLTLCLLPYVLCPYVLTTPTTPTPILHSNLTKGTLVRRMVNMTLPKSPFLLSLKIGENCRSNKNIYQRE